MGFAQPLPVSHGSARSLLLTILGEFLYPTGAPIWTATLLHTLAGVGVEEKTARQAIARGAASGWISSERDGRTVRWRLTDAGRELIREGSERVRSFAATTCPWDRAWLILMITVPESSRVVRRRLYGRLNWAGFGNPAAGIWVSPHPEREAEAKRIINELDLTVSTFSFIGPYASIGVGERDLVAQAWRLDVVAAHYADLLDRFAGLQPQAGDEVLFTYIQLVNEIQRIPFVDPQLPAALLPDDWIGRRATTLLNGWRAEWRAAAHAEWQVLTSSATARTPTPALR